MPALHIKDKYEKARQEVDIIECYEDVGNPGSGLTKIKNQLFKISKEITEKKLQFDAIAIDSLTTISMQAMRMVLHNSGKMEQGAVRLQRSSSGALHSGIEIQHYGLAMQEVENCLMLLTGMPVLGICIAHDDTETIDERQQKIVSVLGNKLAPKVPAFFNEVWYSLAAPQGAGKVDMVLQTQASASIMCRSRDGLANGFKMDQGFPTALASIGYKWEV